MWQVDVRGGKRGAVSSAYESLEVADDRATLVYFSSGVLAYFTSAAPT
jgi:hypothetical protein